MSKIVIGTAGWGSSYPAGSVDFDEATNIVAVADKLGVSWFDTAPTYGKAEQWLGKLLPDHERKWHVVTKVAHSDNNSTRNHYKPQTNNSIELLGSNAYVHLHIHNYNYTASIDGKLHEALQGANIVSGGATVYNKEDAYRAYTDMALIKNIVVPYSILDRRHESTMAEFAFAKKLKNLWARSVFLQGIIADAVGWRFRHDVPASVKRTAEIYHFNCDRAGLDPAAVAFKHVVNNDNFQKVVVGIRNANQLARLVKWEKKEYTSEEVAVAHSAIDAARKVQHDVDPRWWG
jgi:aryl-alcohol dehydrogenase-like predicted oxidoreductase